MALSLSVWILFVYLCLCITSANSLCTFPCAVQSKGQYTSDFGTFQFSCKNSSALIRSYGYNKEIQECYERSGPFTLLRRNGNEFQCVKEADIEGKITWVYETPFIKCEDTPTLCSMCSPALMRPVVYVASEVKLHFAKKLKPPPIGCNIPKNCPMLSHKDIPCVGCEPVDDGQCCLGCGTPLPAPLIGPFVPHHHMYGPPPGPMDFPMHGMYWNKK